MSKDQRQLSSYYLEVMTLGEAEILGRLPYGSNSTLLIELTHQGEKVRAVYKPVAGERPLWDYPPGLHKRELASYLLDRYLGIGAVPETIIRSDLPLGEGSLQRFVDADFSQHYFSLLEREELHPQMARICAFDLVANSGDRKSGHILIDANSDHLWGIDNGLTLHSSPKLRTVIWEFGGVEIDEDLTDAFTAIGRQIPSDLEDLYLLLDPPELAALRKRAKKVSATRVLPEVDMEYRHYPWPII